jgi:anti-sigma-K factor RskA
MDRHDLVQPLLTDYVLGELRDAERQQVETHLAACDRCATEVRELSLAFGSIGLSEEPIAPPPHLRARVLDSLERNASSNDSRVRELRIRRLPGAIAVAGGLAASLLVVLGTMFAVSMHRNTELRRSLAATDAEVSRLATQLADNRSQADRAVAILTASDMRRIDLAGYDASRDAIARAYWSAQQGLLIVADHLPPPPAGRVYQVWIIESGSSGPVSAGVIDAERGGRGMLIVPPPSGVRGGAITVAVTDEPPGGLAAPTGSKHLAGS